MHDEAAVLTIAAAAGLAAGLGRFRLRRWPRTARSARSSSTAPIPARARPTTKSWSAPASPKSERYRIPERYRAGGSRQSRQAWANKAPAASKPSARPASTAARRSARPASPAALQQVINQALSERERRGHPERNAAGGMSAEPRSAPSSLAIQASICASSASSGTEPCPSTASWKRRRSNLSPSCLFGPRAQLADLQLADLVGQRLAGVGDVAIDLGFDIGVGKRGIVVHEGDRLLLGPALGVDAGVDHQPGRAPHLIAQPAHVLLPACRRGPSRSRAAPNRAPSPRRRR